MLFNASCVGGLAAAVLFVLSAGCSSNEAPPLQPPLKGSPKATVEHASPSPKRKVERPGAAPITPSAAVTERPVAFAVDPKTSDSVLSCTLNLPNDAKTRLAVVVVGEASPRDRHGTRGKARPYAALAQRLARDGVAVLRCDGRGIGGSKGRATMMSVKDREQDARAMWQFLRTQKGIDPHRVGFIGHEQGTWIAARVAANQPEVAFVVGLGPVAADGGATLRNRLERALRTRGAGAGQIEAASKALQRLIDVVRMGGSDATLTAAVEALVSAKRVATSARPQPFDREAHIRTEQMRWRAKGAPTWIHMRATADYVKLVETPTLFVFGRKDPLTHTDLHHGFAAKALTKAGHPRHEVRIVDGDIFDGPALREALQWMHQLSVRANK